MLRSAALWAFLLFVLVLSGCPSTIPCPEGTIGVEGSGCVPTDADVDDGGDAGLLDVLIAMPDGEVPLLDGGDGGGIPEDGCTPVALFVDFDRDGHGDPSMPVSTCVGVGFADVGDDCDDTTDQRHPGLAETCDGLDNDCNMNVDEGVLTTYYRDADMDMHGTPAMTMDACAPPAGYVALDDDCDDTSGSRFRGQPRDLRRRRQRL